MSHRGHRDITLGQLLTQLAGEQPDREALVYAGGPRFTFAQLEREARTIARGLMAAGVERGERVVLWATNVPEWVVLQFALCEAVLGHWCRNFLGPTSASFIHRDCFARYGPFSSEIVTFPDLEYWIRVGSNEGLAIADRYLAILRA